MNSELCIDANIVVKWYMYENLHDEAVLLLEETERLGIRLVAPDFIFAETGATIRKLVYRGLLSLENGLLTISLMKRIDIKRYDVRDLYEAAWHMANRYNLPTLYDAYYLALADLRGCNFWTADERFINSVPGLPQVKNIKDFTEGILES